jgi:UDP-glucose 4-epimerase
MKVLVTGGAGYIASHTIIELLNAGYEVAAIDNFSNSSMESIRRVEKISGKKISFYEADIQEKDTLCDIITKEEIKAVIHFAGLKAVGESCSIPLKYFRNNLVGTITLLEVMQECNVKNLVFSSSATVYGEAKTIPITEDYTPLSVTNPYGRTKLMIEEMLQDLYRSDSSWNIAILRYFNPIGAHESGEIGEDPNGIPNNLVPYIAKVAMGELDHIKVYGNDYDTPDGTGIRDYIHVVDLALGHIKAIEKLSQNPGLEIYNLGTGVGYSVLEIIHNYELACGKKLPYTIEARRPGDIAVSYADPSKAFRELGWKAERDIHKMCEDSYRWQSKNPKGYGK